MRKILKRVLISLLAISLLLGVAACGGSKTVDETQAQVEETTLAATTAQTTAAKDEKKIIGMVPTSIANNPLYMFVTEACKKIADENNITFNSIDVKMDASLQITAMENLIAQKVNVIIVDPVDAASISPQIKKAMEQGIKIISLSGQTDAYDTYMTIDHKQCGILQGKMAAKWINEKLGGKAEVGILNYRSGAVLINREDGIREGLAADCAGASIVAVGQADNPTDGMKVTENFLQAHPNIKVILAVNDAGALGAVEAVKAAGKATDDFAVFGDDSAQEALALIKEGSIFRGTVYLYPERIPGTIMDNAIKMANGETVDKEIRSDIDIITKDNFDQIIKQ